MQQVESRTIVIVGAGGVGGLLAAAIRATGLHIHGPDGDATATIVDARA